MASRKEQKEQLRREREQREAEQESVQRRKQLVGYGAGGAAVLVIVAVAAVLLIGSGGGDKGKSGDSSAALPGGGSVPEQKITDLAAAAEAAGCTLKSSKGKSRDHTESLDVPITYNSKPPSDGKHFVEAAADGAYDTAPDQRKLVHTLEHGRVIIWFKKSMAADRRAGLKAIFDDDSFQMVLTPDPTKMPYQVAATAWSREPTPNGTGRLLGCPRMTDQTYDAIRTFRDEYRGNGPEATP